MVSSRSASSAVLMFLVLAAVAYAQPSAPLKVVNLTTVGLGPEGIATGWGPVIYGAGFLGKIYKANVVSGEVEIIYDAFSNLGINTLIGLKVSKPAKLMYVSGGPSGKGLVFQLNPATGYIVGQPTVLTLSTSTAPGTTFINDVTLTTSSNDGKSQVTAYFTDSNAGNVYEVTGCPDACTLSATYTAPQFQVAPGQFGLNGLVSDPIPGNTLIVGHSAQRKLYKMVLADGAATVTEVSVTLPNGTATPVFVDGLLLQGSRTLYVAENALNRVAKVVFTSSDYTQAVLEQAVRDPLFVTPTTVAFGAGSLYAVNAKFQACGRSSPATPTSCTYELVRVDFE